VLHGRTFPAPRCRRRLRRQGDARLRPKSTNGERNHSDSRELSHPAQLVWDSGTNLRRSVSSAGRQFGGVSPAEHADHTDRGGVLSRQKAQARRTPPSGQGHAPSGPPPCARMDRPGLPHSSRDGQQERSAHAPRAACGPPRHDRAVDQPSEARLRPGRVFRLRIIPLLLPTPCPAPRSVESLEPECETGSTKLDLMTTCSGFQGF